MKKIDFIKKAEIVHCNKYDYTNVNYINNKEKVKITCPIHGEFTQRPDKHLSGCGCKKCAFDLISELKKDDVNSFIEKANKKHNCVYDYNKSIYLNSTTPIEIKCSIHGSFWQKPSTHIAGHKCPKCSLNNRKIIRSLTTIEFTEKAKLIHYNKYKYDKCIYENGKTMVEIECPLHGVFKQRAESHLRGVGCPNCNPSNKLKCVDFIDRANNTHGNKYNYDKSLYINSKTKLIITCPDHGEFNQIPSDHLNGHGCPICSESMLEKIVGSFLSKKGIAYDRQKKFNWLGSQSLDFYIPDINLAIECQGIQHFKPIEYFGGVSEFNKIKERDKRKNTLCNKNGVNLKYISYFDNALNKIEAIMGSMI